MAMTMPQGLRLEPMVEDIQRLLKVGARMYMCMTRATLEKHGREGEMPVRLGLRAYGLWRGREMREAHHALGLEINMASLIQCWDSASVFIVKDRKDTAPDSSPTTCASTCICVPPPWRGRRPISTSGGTSIATNSIRPARRPITPTATSSSRRT